MIDVVKVAKAVRKLVNVSEDDSFDVIPTVSVACAQLSDRLLKPEYAKDSRVISAAVYLSYYRLLLRNILQSEGQTSFKAGDITVSQSPEIVLEKAALLRDDAICTASALLKDMDFMFRQV